MRFIMTVFLFLFPIALSAQGFTTSVEGDLTGDGIIDRAELRETAEGGEADLLIWQGQANGDLKLRSQANAVVWVGGIGQQPELMISPYGSLLVVSMNESIGRDRWHETLTVAWRKGAFLLAGYTMEWYDTLNLANAGICDVNLLTGKGERATGADLNNKTVFRTIMRGGPIAKWNRETPAECAL